LLCDVVASQYYPFFNTSLSWEERVDDLVSRLTLDEIVLQLARGGIGRYGFGNNPAPGIPRLGIDPYSWNTECLSGDVGAGKATSFPIAIGMAATFSREAIYTMAETTSIELRAKYYDYISRGIYGDHRGLSCFAPVINIMRHPLWGRNQETYGEDPFLSGQLATQYVRGLQGNHSRFVRASAGCKHFDVYAGPETIPESRFSFNAIVSERDWRVTFQPAFKACVEAGTYNLMCSYNSINGIPACANYELLTTVLREEWGFTGYVISDQQAIENIIDYHHYYNNSVELAAGCINAGTNLQLNDGNANNTFMLIPEAIRQGLLTEETVIERVKPLYMTRMRLGEFDPPETNPYLYYDLSVIQSPDHRARALDAAVKSFVLLKNRDGFLPLNASTYGTISVVGPMADNPDQYYGDYSPSHRKAPFLRTPVEALQDLADTVQYAAGCKKTTCKKYHNESLIAAVEGAEIVFVCLGTGTDVEAEGRDRSDIQIPGYQEQILRDAIDASNGAPIVLLLFNAGPVVIDTDLLDQVDSIIECFFPAQSTGDALLSVLTGETNPAARLPYTWESSMAQVPDMVNYTMVNRTYRYWYQDQPLYPFGYGLSYTTFSYSNLTISPTDGSSDRTVTVDVTNTGSRDGDEVVQVYVQWVSPSEIMPALQLVEFDRVTITAGSTVTVSLTVPADRFMVYTDADGFVLEDGDIVIYVGGQQPNQAVNVTSNVLQQTITISTA
jgi:beta-glucosidase